MSSRETTTNRTQQYIEWRRHSSEEDRRYIDQNHGTERFRQIVGGALGFGAFYFIKAILPTQHHAELERSWNIARIPGNAIHDLKADVIGRIADFFVELDDHTGAHAQKGSAWMDRQAHAKVQKGGAWVDQKAQDLSRYIHQRMISLGF